MTTRKPRPNSKPAILNAAVSLAAAKGLRKFSRDEVAEKSGMASATVSFHFGTMDDLRKEVVTVAIQREYVSILADARADRDSAKLFTGMSAELKEKVAAYIAR